MFVVRNASHSLPFSPRLPPSLLPRLPPSLPAPALFQRLLTRETVCFPKAISKRPKSFTKRLLAWVSTRLSQCVVMYQLKAYHDLKFNFAILQRQRAQKPYTMWVYPARSWAVIRRQSTVSTSYSLFYGTLPKSSTSWQICTTSWMTLPCLQNGEGRREDSGGGGMEELGGRE